MTFKKYLKKSMKYFLGNKGQIRLGQAYYNMLPNALAANIRTTDLDPFFNNMRLENFLLYVQEHWSDE